MEFIKKAELGRFELFNLADDPGEQTNLAAANPDKLKTMKDTMVKLHREIRAEGPEYQLQSAKKKRR